MFQLVLATVYFLFFLISWCTQTWEGFMNIGASTFWTTCPCIHMLYDLYMCVLICRLVSPTWFLLEGEEAHPITIVLGISYLGLGSDLANQLATKVVELNDEYKAGEMLNQWDMKLGLNVGWCGKHSCGIGVMVDFMSSSMALTQEAVATSVFVRQAQVAKSTRHNVHYGM